MRFGSLNAVIKAIGFVLAFGGSGQLLAADDAKESVTILVAVSTKDAVEEIAKTYVNGSGLKIVVSPGASNALANQIINGAPADLFLSANQEWADKVKTEKLAAEIRPLLGNTLVIVVPKGNPAKIAKPKDLAGESVKKIALAGEKVPAGLYAQQALEALALYQQLESDKKVVRGQDARATLNYVEQAEVEAGIVYATDAKISRKVDSVYTFDAKLHDKIVYPLVLTNQGKQNAAAVKFFNHLQSKSAADVFKKYGFEVLK